MDLIKDHQKIAHIEKVEIDLKIHHLTRDMRTKEFDDLPFIEHVLIMVQLSQMKGLSETLERRIQLFK